MPGTMYLRRTTPAADERPPRFEAIYQEQRGAPEGRQYAREFESLAELKFFLAEKLHITHDAVDLAMTELQEFGKSELKNLTIRSIDLVAEKMVTLHGQY